MHLLLTTFGLGHMRFASGTWGSLPPVVLAAILFLAGLSPAGAHNAASSTNLIIFNAVFAAILIVFSLVCIVGGKQAEGKWGKDPGEVVADETAGQCLPLLALPACAFASWLYAGLTLAGAFLLFRLFDIIKPWPANGLQSKPHGWGILLDDLFAGLYAAIVLQVVVRLTMCG
jgi:phosphatidylglycerophosphatase A